MNLAPYATLLDDANQNNSYLLPPRGLEHKSTSNESKTTYDSHPAKRWPKSGTDSAKTPKISPEQPNPLPDDLAQIVAAWSSLPEHIKAAIKALVQTNITEIK